MNTVWEPVGPGTPVLSRRIRSCHCDGTATVGVVVQDRRDDDGNLVVQLDNGPAERWNAEELAPLEAILGIHATTPAGQSAGRWVTYPGRTSGPYAVPRQVVRVIPAGRELVELTFDDGEVGVWPAAELFLVCDPDVQMDG